MKRLVLCFAMLLAGCGTSPEPAYYALAAVDGTPLPGVSKTIKIQRPTVPGYLDRPDMIREENIYQYTIDDMQRWAEPLDRGFERVLAEDLRQRLPDSHILSESDTGTAGMRYIVETAIEQFNATGGNQAGLKAVLSIKDKKTGIAIKPVQLELTTAAEAGPESIAASLSNLVAHYADRLQTELRDK